MSCDQHLTNRRVVALKPSWPNSLYIRLWPGPIQRCLVQSLVRADQRAAAECPVGNTGTRTSDSLVSVRWSNSLCSSALWPVILQTKRKARDSMTCQHAEDDKSLETVNVPGDVNAGHSLNSITILLIFKKVARLCYIIVILCDLPVTIRLA